MPGHWEGDLLIGRRNQTAIGTLVRSSGFTMLIALPDGYKPEHVAPALARKVHTLPAALRRSLTWDQGPEMRDWKQIHVDAGIDVFFCDPHAPWQRGSNENTKGLQYFPKGFDFSSVTEAELDAVADELNERPQALRLRHPDRAALRTAVAITARIRDPLARLTAVGDEPELIGGRERRAIVVVPYDPSWAARFERERRRIAAALGPGARRIDHIGSTAVVGLVAKPIVDLDVSVADVEDEQAYVPTLERAGYRLRVREPRHRMLRTPELDVHVHVCSAGSDWERRHLLFRDWLRCNLDDRERYAATKRALALHDWPDMNAYADAKGTVIAQITARAERWALQTHWKPR